LADFHRTFVNADSFIRGAARLLWAGTTVTFPTKISDVINMSIFDAATGWNDLGATKTGITISHNNAEETFDVDQIQGDLDTLPTNWEMSVATALAEMTLERLQVAWEGGPITTDATVTPNEKEMGIGSPQSYTQRRLAVLFQRPNGKIRGFFFRKVQRMAQESSAVFNKTGEQQTVPVRFKALADTSISDVFKRFAIIRDQQ
jgi:hypothetical protein